LLPSPMQNLDKDKLLFGAIVGALFATLLCIVWETTTPVGVLCGFGLGLAASTALFLYTMDWRALGVAFSTFIPYCLWERLASDAISNSGPAAVTLTYVFLVFGGWASPVSSFIALAIMRREDVATPR
jgi:hypothetical protein